MCYACVITCVNIQFFNTPVTSPYLSCRYSHTCVMLEIMRIHFVRIGWLQHINSDVLCDTYVGHSGRPKYRVTCSRSGDTRGIKPSTADAPFLIWYRGGIRSTANMHSGNVLRWGGGGERWAGLRVRWWVPYRRSRKTAICASPCSKHTNKIC